MSRLAYLSAVANANTASGSRTLPPAPLPTTLKAIAMPANRATTHEAADAPLASAGSLSSTTAIVTYECERCAFCTSSATDARGS